WISVNSKCVLRNEDFQLIELTKQPLFQLGKETSAAFGPKVENRQDDYQIQVEPTLALPDAAEREIPLLSRQTSKSCHQTSFQGIKDLFADGLATVIGQREIKVVTPSRSRHGWSLRSHRRGERQFRKATSCGEGGEPGGQSLCRCAPD